MIHQLICQLIVLSLITGSRCGSIVNGSTERDEGEEIEEDEESPAEDLPDQEGERVCRVEYIE